MMSTALPFPLHVGTEVPDVRRGRPAAGAEDGEVDPVVGPLDGPDGGVGEGAGGSQGTGGRPRGLNEIAARDGLLLGHRLLLGGLDLGRRRGRGTLLAGEGRHDPYPFPIRVPSATEIFTAFRIQPGRPAWREISPPPKPGRLDSAGRIVFEDRQGRGPAS